jgi:hypothetical protein
LLFLKNKNIDTLTFFSLFLTVASKESKECFLFLFFFLAFLIFYIFTVAAQAATPTSLADACSVAPPNSSLCLAATDLP